jgi:hypothetical protein
MTNRQRTHRPPRLTRWVCPCQDPPVLLGTYDSAGRIHLKSRDRYWHVRGYVRTVCPKCGAEHTLELPGLAEKRNGNSPAEPE